MGYACPCQFVGGPDLRQFSRPWYEAHRDHHLATFPDVDDRTREVLDELIAGAAP